MFVYPSVCLSDTVSPKVRLAKKKTVDKNVLKRQLWEIYAVGCLGSSPSQLISPLFPPLERF
jgi:hypothetical protein